MEVEDHHYPLSRFDVREPFYVLINDSQRPLHVEVAPVTGDFPVSVRTKPMRVRYTRAPARTTGGPIRDTGLAVEELHGAP